VRSTRKRLAAAAAFLGAALLGLAQDAAVAPPAKNWTLPLFTKEGYRQMTLKGSEVRPVDSDRIDISGLDVTVFSGDPEGKVETVITSPQASFMINEKIARGDHSVRMVRDDVDVTGVGWTYYYNEKKVLIAHNAHVVFHAGLPQLLK
jgi:hypothetical protein